jgi:hypothetical protein
MRKRDVQALYLSAAGDWHEGMWRLGWLCGGRSFVGGWKTLMREKGGEAFMMIEIRQEGCIDRPSSDIPLSRQDIRSKFNIQR